MGGRPTMHPTHLGVCVITNEICPSERFNIQERKRKSTEPK